MPASSTSPRIAWQPGRGSHAEIIVERREPFLHLAQLRVPLPPGTFLQATAEGLLALQTFADEALIGAGSLVDLYCGLGSLSLPLAGRLERHMAVDADAAAIAALRRTSLKPGSSAIDCRVQDLECSPLGARELRRYEAAILDPPRAGAKSQASELAASSLSRLVYVSCNPASFARDAALLVAGGFRIERILPVDQFLYSSEIELAASFVR